MGGLPPDWAGLTRRRWAREGVLKAPGSFDDLVPIRGTLEILYAKSHRYWDDSGNVVAQVEQTMPTLSCTKLGPRGFEFQAEPESGLVNAAFYWNRVGLEVDVKVSHRRFEERAVKFWHVVASALEVGELTRVGNRYAYLFSTDTIGVADELLANLGAWSLSAPLEALGDPDSRGIVLRTILPAQDRRIRLELAAGEHPLHQKRQVGVLLDIDFSTVKVPTSKTLDVAAFLRWNQRFVRDHLHQVLRARP